ncbi:hypothetical protein GSI_02008 [Ganoderma sinense ZZ0214-1]|uniref:Uncharacterized protein n=1 Tax=Ganoderma sinense ZZ0214-1 TaxID=1077348 RepID=A0A2G8SNI6_9APHY|nr:hypothetical protein GSI_02008 [Ganoderma sinense ZZ0214-1]
MMSSSSASASSDGPPAACSYSYSDFFLGVGLGSSSSAARRRSWGRTRAARSFASSAKGMESDLRSTARRWSLRYVDPPRGCWMVTRAYRCGTRVAFSPPFW